MSTEAGDPAISVSNVSKRFRLYRERPQSLKERIVRRRRARYDEFWALHDVSLTIDQGAFYGIIGHNGSGKSTLLRIIAGIHRPTSGAVTATGRVAALLELGSGFHPDLTGRENVFLNGAILGLGKKQINRCFDEIVDFSGLHEFIDIPVKLYSSGMYLRLGFSVAVHLDPEILLIDEIIAVGDEEFQRRSLDHLHSLRRKGITIVLVSHSLETIGSLCKHAAWLDHGRLLGEGPSGDVIDKYLSKVNADERQRLDGRGSATTSPPPGSRQHLRIERVEFLTGDGSPTAAVRTGEPVVIRTHYSAPARLHDPTFHIDVDHESGVHLFGVNTHHARFPTGTVEGEGSIDFRVERLLLLPGSYLISVEARDEDSMHRFDRRHKSDVLHVQPALGGAAAGLMEPAGEWQLPVATEKRSLTT